MTAVSNSTHEGSLIHIALPYHGDEEFIGGIVSFLEAGFEADEPALVFAPTANLDLVRAELNGSTSAVTFLDATGLARNPARIIPEALRFTDQYSGRRVRIVGQGIWPGRSGAELREFVRHEALVNVLFADVAAMILCPYDAVGLDASVVADAGRTHSHVIMDGAVRHSPLYVDPLVTLSVSAGFPAPPENADRFGFGHGDSGALRRFVLDRANRFGLGGERARDLMLAVSEATSNTVAHTEHGGTLLMWSDAEAVICEVSDRGHIVVAHLVGRRTPPTDSPRGRGIWIMNQVCDLVQLHSDETGTVIRMHVSLDRPE